MIFLAALLHERGVRQTRRNWGPAAAPQHREYLTEEELMGHLREQGIDQVEMVKSATIEGDGRIFVVEVSK
jgi:hypothetical protein